MVDEDLGYIAANRLARHGGAPIRSARIRAAAEDFVVDEQLELEPSKHDAHWWLRIRKRSLTTDAVVRMLASMLSIAESDVGFSGMKDRIAVTTQWMSVPARALPDPWSSPLAERQVVVEDPDAYFELVEISAQRRKLRRGVHGANRFQLKLTDADFDRERLVAAVDAIRSLGFPNYFGPQRFGTHGGNVAAAHAFLSGRRRVRRSLQRGLYLSTARSVLFNRQLHLRVSAGNWATRISGDVLLFDGRDRPLSKERMAQLGDSAIATAIERQELHPAGVLCGRGEHLLSEMAKESFERAVDPVPFWCSGLEAQRVDLSYRALRARADDLCLLDTDASSATLGFTLTRGAYATGLLRELVTEF